MADPAQTSSTSSSQESKEGAKWDSASHCEDLDHARPVNNPIPPAPAASDTGPLTAEEAWSALGRLPDALFRDGSSEQQARWRRAMVPRIAALVARIDAHADPTGATPNLAGRRAFFHCFAAAPRGALLWSQTLAAYFAAYPAAIPARDRPSFDAKFTETAEQQGRVAARQWEYLRGWDWDRATRAPAAPPLCDCVAPRRFLPSRFAESICGCAESQIPTPGRLQTLGAVVRSLPQRSLLCMTKSSEKLGRRLSRAG